MNHIEVSHNNMVGLLLKVMGKGRGKEFDVRVVQVRTQHEGWNVLIFSLMYYPHSLVPTCKGLVGLLFMGQRHKRPGYRSSGAYDHVKEYNDRGLSDHAGALPSPR